MPKKLQPTVQDGTADWIHGIAKKLGSSDSVAAGVVLNTAFTVKEIKDQFDDPGIAAGLYGDGDSEESEQ